MRRERPSVPPLRDMGISRLSAEERRKHRSVEDAANDVPFGNVQDYSKGYPDQAAGKALGIDGMKANVGRRRKKKV